MLNAAERLFALAAALGAAGLVLLGILDSSFLFMPLGNDLLMLGLTARNPGLLVWYAASAALGSTLGTLLVDLVCRKGGRDGLRRLLPPRRLNYVTRRVEKRAGWAVILACVMPPPFPFTPVIAAASAFQFPRAQLLATVAAGRAVRFTAIGVLAIHFGPSILRIGANPAVRYSIIAIVVLAIAGSVVSVAGWIRRSRSRPVSAGTPLA